MNDKNEKREFVRSLIEPEIEVFAENMTGKRFKEKTALIDLSGGGAKFKTTHVENYFPGQLLGFTIYLHGTDHVKACMKGNAKVVRIGSAKPSEPKEKGLGDEIAVRIDIPLHFERVNGEK
ncbi:PilZ domain-containing protein [Thermodesulfobacteriota bacterium]